MVFKWPDALWQSRKYAGLSVMVQLCDFRHVTQSPFFLSSQAKQRLCQQGCCEDVMPLCSVQCLTERRNSININLLSPRPSSCFYPQIKGQTIRTAGNMKDHPAQFYLSRLSKDIQWNSGSPDERPGFPVPHLLVTLVPLCHYIIVVALSAQS